MKQTLVVAGREIREKSRLFLLAAILSVMSFITLLIPMSASDRPSVLAICATFVSVALGVGLAITLGVSTIGRDLKDRRLSFYFARPLSSASIWFGKAGASIATSIVCLLIVLAPAAIVLWKRIERTEIPTLAGLGYIALSILVMFLLAHTLSTMIRSRSALFGLDIILFVAAASVLYSLVRPLFLYGPDASILVVAVIGAAIVLVLALAPLWQLAKGRTDIRRSHAALSLALWSGIALVIVLAAAGIGWLAGAAPEEWDQVGYISQAPNSTWVFGSGTSASRMGYLSTWMFNAATGEREKIDGPLWWGGVHFSKDGRVAAWQQQYSPFRRGEVELYVRRFDRNAKTIATGIRMPHSSIVLSDDGSRIAIAGHELVSVYDVESGRVLAAARGLSKAGGRVMHFVTPDVVRLVQYEPRRGGKDDFTIAELDVRTKKLTQTGAGKLGTGSWYAVAVSGDGSRMLLRERSVIADARTGAPLATVPARLNQLSSAMLRDGSVVAGARENEIFHLRTFNRDGQPMHDIVLPGVRWAQPVGQLSDSKLVIVGYTKRSTERTGVDRKIFVVDLARGVIERTAENMFGGFSMSPVEPQLPQLGTAPIISLDAKGDLVLWDPRTGNTKPMS